MGAHTTLPILGHADAEGLRSKSAKGRRQLRDILVIVNESTSNECNEPRQMAYIHGHHRRDGTPFGISNFDRSRAARQLLRARRPLRRALVERVPSIPPRYDKRIVFIDVVQRGAFAPWTSATRNSPKEIASYIPGDHRGRPTRRCVKRARPASAASARSSRTTSKSTIAATSTWSIARIPGCTSSSSRGRRARRRSFKIRRTFLL